MSQIPNLFLVGAMRAGTTALHEALGRHPDVFMSEVKEPAHFTDPAELAADSRVATAAGYAADRDKYLRLFEDRGSARYVGESSTHYTKAPRINGVAERIFGEVPEARIIYLMRDPVERTLSHYRFAVRKKYERRPVLDAVRGDPFYCAVSDYARQIGRYLDRFGNERVYLAVLEELAADPGAQLDHLFEWLGLDPMGSEARFWQRNEVAENVTQARGPEILHQLGRSPGYQTVARALVPGSVRSATRRLLSRPVTATDVNSPEVIDYLQSVHLPQVVDLEELTGQTFPRWKRVRPS